MLATVLDKQYLSQGRGILNPSISLVAYLIVAPIFLVGIV